MQGVSRETGTGDGALLGLGEELLPKCCRQGRPRVQTCPASGKPRGAALGESLHLSPAQFPRQDFKKQKTKNPKSSNPLTSSFSVAVPGTSLNCRRDSYHWPKGSPLES